MPDPDADFGDLDAETRGQIDGLLKAAREAQSKQEYHDELYEQERGSDQRVTTANERHHNAARNTAQNLASSFEKRAIEVAMDAAQDDE